MRIGYVFSVSPTIFPTIWGEFFTLLLPSVSELKLHYNNRVLEIIKLVFFLFSDTRSFQLSIVEIQNLFLFISTILFRAEYTSTRRAFCVFLTMPPDYGCSPLESMSQDEYQSSPSNHLVTTSRLTEIAPILRAQRLDIVVRSEKINPQNVLHISQLK